MAANLEDNLRKGPWEEDEDELLKAVVERIGEGRWDSLAQASGLLRSGKSCRLRWLNYLRPNLKRGKISVEEETIIIQLQQQWGNKWSKIAKMLPGRTDNELKNYWRTRIRKQQSQSRKLEIHANRSMSFEQESSIAGTFESLGINGGNQEFSDEKIPDDICAQTASISETNSFGLDVGSCSDFGMAYSPYEARLENWVSDFSDGKYASKDQMEATLGIGYESCDVSEECFYSLWDS